MKKPVLVSGIILLALLGAAGGYYGGNELEANPSVHEAGPRRAIDYGQPA
ncbi:hypothetical protein [Kribbella qitaiheensis]|nr:hypothetical protein [Kribbella qitaiheensis]